MKTGDISKLLIPIQLMGIVLGSKESIENSYKYLGQYGVITDSDSLIYVRARYYSPDLGRWTQLDAKRGAITNPLSLNRYVLNEGDGVNYVDISGFERGKVGWTWSDTGHLLLDGAGLVPLVGEFFDGANALWYLAEGDKVNAGLSASGMIPFVGWGAIGAKIGIKTVKTIKTTEKFLNPKTIRFTQNSIGNSFKNGQKLGDVVQELKTGKISPDDFPPIRIFEKNGKIYSLDNRRLKVFQEAGINVKTISATAEEIKKEAWKFTTKNDGINIRIRGN